MRPISAYFVLAPLLALFSPLLSAQTLGADFATDYSFVDLGTPPGVPAPLGGVTFKAGDTNVLLIGGSANNSGGAIYEVPITRDALGHISGYVGASTIFSTAANIDGGLEYGPGGVLFFTTYSNNMLGQILPGSVVPDLFIDLTALGICSSVGTLRTVPAGFAGAGQLKVASYNCGDFYDIDIAPGAMGTYDITNVTPTILLPGGPEGIVYISDANPAFAADSVLVSEYSANSVGAYEIDANGDPIDTTRRDFISGLTGAEGAELDPVSGDFIFSTFGGGNTVIIVSGFAPTGTNYCPLTPNSNGDGASITFSGSTSVTANDLELEASGASVSEPGLFYYGTTQTQVPFGEGNRCVGGSTVNLWPPTVSDGLGGNSRGIDVTSMAISASVSPIVVGGTQNFQYWFRDPAGAGPNGFNLSNGLSLTFLP